MTIMTPPQMRVFATDYASRLEEAPDAIGDSSAVDLRDDPAWLFGDGVTSTLMVPQRRD